jgi:hypothetical protein
MKQKSKTAIYDIQKIFNWIVEDKGEHDGNSPTLRELMRACNISSTSVVCYTLRRLERAGKIYLSGPGGQTRRIAVIGGMWHLTNHKTCAEESG